MEQGVSYATTGAASRFEPAVSWGAIFAGVFTALATSIVLTTLAAGFGLSLATPGVDSGEGVRGFSPESGAWMVGCQALSAAFGGFITGRLRTQWSSIHNDEAHFRDTAHGLIVWAASTVIGVILAAMVLAPLAGAASGAVAVAPTAPPPSVEEIARAAHLAGQATLFMGVGFLLSAFMAAVAARLGGLHGEHFHARRVVA